MKLILAFILSFFISLHSHSQSIKFYISPGGDDQSAGTENAPLRSLEAARNKIRSLKNDTAAADTIYVIVEPGNYGVTETFTLFPEDSGTPSAPVVYTCEDGGAIFSGGREISGFTETGQGLWVTHVPEVTYWNWTFDQLYVNGKRATRAKSPNTGYYHIKEITEEVWVQGTGRSPEKAQQIVKINEDAASQLNSLDDSQLDQAIMTVFHNWNITKRHIDRYDRETSTIYTAGQGMKPWNPWKSGKRFILENYFAALDNPGEWFLQNDGTLFYKPFPGDKIEETVFIVPVIEQLINIKGAPERGKYVENVIFRNLHFQHTAYNLPREGFEPYQAAITIGAAIELNGARNIRFVNCQLEHTGGYGIWLNQAVEKCEIEHCYLNDLGAGGIRIGETTLRDKDYLQTHFNRIDNNIISSGGFEFPTAVGVLICHSGDNQVTHNDIGDFRYTGVSVGWRWGYDYSPAKNNKILNNHIHHIGWGILSDMSGVYTLGPSEGTEVSHNHVHHIYAYDYGGWGLYTDEGSSNILLENNLVHHTKTGGFHQHYGKENVLRNNIFAFSKMYQLQATRVEDHKSFSFTNNIVIYHTGVLYQGPWTKMDVSIDKNLYWNTNGPVFIFEKPLKDWQKNDYDLHSVIEDPKFKDAANSDFSFTSKKAIKKISFTPFDYSECGVYGSEVWKDKAKLPEAVILEFDKLFE